MQRISLRVLNYVEAAARHGNVTAAAREKNVSQSSVSLAISELEKLAGVPLFVRHHAKGISLTPAGRLIMNDTRQLLNHARDFEKRARSLSDEVRGEIAVGAFVTIGARFMPKLLARFAQAFPGIGISLEEGSQAEIVEMLLAGRVEIALSYHSALRENLSAEFIGELPPHALLPLSDPLAGREDVGLAELADRNFILLDLPYSRDYFLGLFRAVGVEPRIAFRSQSPELIRGLVANGHGFTIHNAVSDNTTANDGTPLAAVPLSDQLPGSRLMCLRHSSHIDRPAAEVFRRFVLQAFGPKGMFAHDIVRRAS